MALEALESFEFFFTLSAQEMDVILPLFKRVHVTAGHTVVEAGAKGKGLYLVASGQARMHKAFVAPSHQDKSLAIFGPGDVFGETNLMNEELNPFSVTSMTDMKIYELSKSDFLEFLKKQPQQALTLMKMLFNQGSDALRRTNLELALQYEVGRIISMGMPLDAMVERLLRQMVISMEVEGAAMLYTSPATGLLEVIGTEGKKAVKCGAIVFRKTLPVLEHIAETEKPIVMKPVRDGVGGTGNSGMFIPGLENHWVLLCPLVEEDQMRGLIVLLDNKNQKGFSRFQEQVMDDLANVLSSAIGLAREKENEARKERLSQKRFR